MTSPSFPLPPDLVAPSGLGLAFMLRQMPEISAQLVSHSPLPKGAKTLAIALDKAGALCILLDHQGAFLGLHTEEELPDDTPITTAAKWQELEELLGVGDSCRQVQETGEMLCLLDFQETLFRSGDALPREGLLGLAVWQPLFQDQLIVLLPKLISHLNEGRQWLLAHRSDADASIKGLLAYSRRLHALGHLWVLSAMGARTLTLWEPALKNLPDALPTFTLATLEQGLFSVALRAFWAVGRLGEEALPGYLEALHEARSPLALLNAFMGIAVLGIRYPTLWKEALHAVTAPLEHQDDALLVSVHRQLSEYAGRLLREPEEERASHLEEGREALSQLAANLGLGAPYHVADPEELPEDLGLSVALFHAGEVTDAAMVLPALRATACLAVAKPQDLYLPKDLLTKVRVPWTPEQTMHFLRQFPEFLEEPPSMPPALKLLSPQEMAGERFLKPLRLSAPQYLGLMRLFQEAPDLTRAVLPHVSLPAASLALAIDCAGEEERGGPYLCLRRDGTFLHCLSPGELPESHFVVPLSEWWGLYERIPGMRERVKELEETAWKETMERIYELLFSRGDRLSREEMQELERVQPLLRRSFLTLFFEVGKRLRAGRRWLLQNRFDPGYQEGLRTYWEQHHALGHLALLAFLEDGLPELMAPSLTGFPEHAVAIGWKAVREGQSGVALRGLRAVGQQGAPVLSGYAAFFRKVLTPLQLITAVGGLLSLALRNEDLREEVREVLSTPEESFAPPIEKGLAAQRRELVQLAEKILKQPEDARAAYRDRGREAAVSLAKRLSVSSSYKYQKPERVPNDLALALMANAVGRLHQPPDVTWLLRGLAFATQARASEFYLPEAYLRETQRPFHPKEAVTLLQAFTEFSNVPEETIDVAGLCPCGSGRAYTTCCGQN